MKAAPKGHYYDYMHYYGDTIPISFMQTLGIKYVN